MLKIFLVAVFMVEGEPIILSGWEPLVVPGMEDCEVARAQVEEYVNDPVFGKPADVEALIACVEAEDPETAAQIVIDGAEVE